MKINYISKVKFIFIVFLVFLFAVFSHVLTGPVLADGSSLWSDQAAYIYQAQEEEYEVGDIITVIIEESINANQGASTSTSQQTDIGGGPGLGFLDFIRAFGFNYSDAEDAGGETEQIRNVSADITVEVREKKDNGNLNIEGTKSIIINNEEQIIRLTGTIDPDDIQEDSIITSRKVADAAIEFEGKGIISDKQDPSILQRIFNWIF